LDEGDSGAIIVWPRMAGIADIRNSKLEIRNSEKTLLRPIGAEFRFSNFDFLLQQSVIVASLLAHLRVVAHFHSFHQEQNIFGNVGGMISEAL